MLIDWFTVGAQALNFLILVWLMKRFLYKPVLHAIDEKAEAAKERDEFKHKQADIDQQRAALLKQATDEAAAERHRLLDAARQAADALSLKRQETLRTEAQSLGQALRRRTQQEVFAIARKALADLATTSLEERFGEAFTRHLREMGGQDKARLADALKTASPALVRTAFDLPAKERATIQNALNETFSADVHVRFETAPDLVCGIELATNGLKVGWNIESYLASLEDSVGELLKEREKAEAPVVPKPKAPVEAKPEPIAEAKPKAPVEPKPDVPVKATPEAKAKAPVEPKPEAPVESKPEAKAQASVEARPEAKAPVVPKPKAPVEPKPEAPVEAKAKAKAPAEPKPEAPVEAKPEAAVEPKPEAPVEAKPEAPVEAKATAEAPVEAKPEVKAEAPVEAKPEAKPGPKPEASKAEAAKA
jgi:F-type H+-transporting ATPase subunit b